MNRKLLRNIGLILLLGLLIGGFLGYDFYQKIFTPNVPDQLNNEYVYIPTGSTFEEVVELLETGGFLIDKNSFEWVADKMSYIKNPMRAGRFKIRPNMSNRRLVAKLRSGSQAAMKVAINNKRTVADVAGFVGKLIEADSLALLRVMQDERFLEQFGLNKETAMTALIPNTYEIYWNTNAEEFFKRMWKEHEKFWNKDRRTMAKDLDMTEKEVYTLASIVEKESQQKSERPRIAGVYLNRLEKGWLLEADPTVVFAVGDFSLRRVLNVHLEYDSPYNTYKYAGLPPGPIYMSSISSIESVLKHENHDYMFFCAEPGGTGSHSFAKTLRGHNVNAAKYREWFRRTQR